MHVLKVKLFDAHRRCPKDPPDASSLEEKMNAFMATLPMTAIADIETHRQWVGSNMKYYGRVVYQGDAH